MLDFLKFFTNRKRGSERIPIKVMFKYSYDNREYMGLLKDICVDGFGFLSSSYVEPGRMVDVELLVQYKDWEGDLKWLSLNERATVKWVVKHKHTVKPMDYSIGCEFTEPDSETLKPLCKMLKKILKHPAK